MQEKNLVNDFSDCIWYSEDNTDFSLVLVKSERANSQLKKLNFQKNHLLELFL